MTTNDRDDEHLRLLSVFHYVLAAITGLFSLFPILHVVIGLLMLSGKLGDDEGPPAELGWLFVGIGAFTIALGMTSAVLMALAGKFLAQRKRHTFCFVVAVVSCINMPFGTILGVFTILVLSRESVKASFE